MKLSLDGRATDARPFIKWAGGKTQLLKILLKLVPRKFNTYYEPFLGGGAMYFALYRSGIVNKAVLGDINEDLIFLYSVVRNGVDDLINTLEQGSYENSAECYYRIREEFNKLRRNKVFSLERAAHMIYLNKTAYNGLWRLSLEGDFNVPFGRYARLNLPACHVLRATSIALQLAELRRGDFEEILSTASEGDFAYLDPPYVPISNTANFTKYTATGFTYDEQKRLARVVKRITERGVFAMISNSNTPEIRDLYSDTYVITTVPALRSISSKSSTRRGVNELIITNYDPKNMKLLAK
ncbi:MAG: DNA adenine methylase [Candidatus Korarchaeota archaeon]